MELQETAEDRHLAKILGISYEDLIELDWNIETDESEDGLIYYYYIEFDKNSPAEILSKIDRLDDDYHVRIESWEYNAGYDYINDQFDVITESRFTHMSFNKELDNLKELSQLQANGDKLKKILNRQIFISIIGAMESYLSEVFLKLIFNDHQYFQSFVETHPDYRTRKFELRDIFKQQNELESTVKKTILDTIFHNLWSVRNMFEKTFDIEFPSIEEMKHHVFIRHHLVHRNGKNKEGIEVEIDDSQIDKLLDDTKSFVNTISEELNIN
ncbi:hypothetical protein ACXR6G_11490 [Ancylomarina sp. YFZ004]